MEQDRAHFVTLAGGQDGARKMRARPALQDAFWGAVLAGTAGSFLNDASRVFVSIPQDQFEERLAVFPAVVKMAYARAQRTGGATRIPRMADLFLEIKALKMS